MPRCVCNRKYLCVSANGFGGLLAPLSSLIKATLVMFIVLNLWREVIRLWLCHVLTVSYGIYGFNYLIVLFHVTFFLAMFN